MSDDTPLFHPRREREEDEHEFNTAVHHLAGAIEKHAYALEAIAKALAKQQPPLDLQAAADAIDSLTAKTKENTAVLQEGLRNVGIPDGTKETPKT